VMLGMVVQLITQLIIGMVMLAVRVAWAVGYSRGTRATTSAGGQCDFRSGSRRRWSRTR
jgi:hypothetical protein